MKGVSFTGYALAAAVVLGVFEGAVRKWVLPDAGAAVHAIPYFSKDVAIAAAVYFSWRTRGNAPVLGGVRDLLTVGTLLILAGTLIVLDGFAPVGAVVSLRNIVALPWVAWLVGPALRQADVVLVCHTIGLCAVVNSFVGEAQFFLPPGHILNQQSNSMQEAIADVGRVRASGTFAYIGGMASLCIAACWAGAVTACRRPWSVFGYGYVFAGVVCAVAAMSRSGAMWGLAVVAGTLVLHPRGRVVGVFAGVVLAIGYVGFADALAPKTDDNDPGLGNAIFVRHSRADSVETRVLWVLLDPLSALEDVPMGTGLGRGQAGQGAADASNYAFVYEVELARVVYEIGVLGFLGAVVTRIGVPLILWRAWGDSDVTRRQRWAWAWYPCLALSPFTLNMNICFDHLLATYSMLATAVAIAAVASHDLGGPR